MRKIEFRAWEEIGEVMHNNFQFIKSGNEGNDWIVFVSDNQKLDNMPHPFENPHFSQQFKIMQFTGLHDKNGVKIFEGDVVKTIAKFGTSGKHPKKIGSTINTVAEVVFTEDGKFTYREPSWQHKLRCDLGNSTDWYRVYCWLNECEVIGNIHQSPELLENKS